MRLRFVVVVVVVAAVVVRLEAVMGGRVALAPAAASAFRRAREGSVLAGDWVEDCGCR